VDDVLATGSSLRAMIAAIEAMGGETVECVVLVDRSDAGRATLTSPTSGRIYALRSLLQLDLPTHEQGPATCPGCAEGRPLLTPDGTDQKTVGAGASAH
jgi:orotate phosphoribosyltransferase